MIEKISAVGSRIKVAYHTQNLTAKVTRPVIETGKKIAERLESKKSALADRIAPETMKKIKNGEKLNKYEKAGYIGMGIAFASLAGTVATGSIPLLAVAGTGIAIALVSETLNILNGRQ